MVGSQGNDEVFGDLIREEEALSAFEASDFATDLFSFDLHREKSFFWVSMVGSDRDGLDVEIDFLVLVGFDELHVDAVDRVWGPIGELC